MRRKNTTTDFLKECMADALLKLLEKKTIDEITISEITDTANVGRVTFYRNFKSKEDILHFKCQVIEERWNEQLTPEEKADTSLLIYSFFNLMNSIRKTLIILYRANLHHIVLLSIFGSLKEKNADMTDDTVYSAAFISFGMFGILTEWVNDGCKKTPQELTDLTLKNMRL